jgi:hypothetical protein
MDRYADIPIDHLRCRTVRSSSFFRYGESSPLVLERVRAKFYAVILELKQELMTTTRIFSKPAKLFKLLVCLLAEFIGLESVGSRGHSEVSRVRSTTFVHQLISSTIIADCLYSFAASLSWTALPQSIAANVHLTLCPLSSSSTRPRRARPRRRPRPGDIGDGHHH